MSRSHQPSNSILVRLIPVLGLIMVSIGCKPAPPGMDELLDPTPVIGCYRSKTFGSDKIAIEGRRIKLNETVIYTRFEYGFDGRMRTPIIYGYPRHFLWSDGGNLAFNENKSGEGVTITIETVDGQPALSLPVFPTSVVSNFGGEVALVTFTRTPCEPT